MPLAKKSFLKASYSKTVDNYEDKCIKDSNL